MKVWADREVELLHRLWNAHYTMQGISERLGRSMKSVRHKAVSLGLGRKRRRGVWSEDTTARAVKMRADSYNSREIGCILGKTKNSVVGRLHRIGAKPPERKPKPKKVTVPKMKKKVLKPRADIAPPNHQAVHIVDRRRDQCAYPIYGPYVCGEPAWEATSWCEYHWALCHKAA